nr:hypothetical protein [Sphingomonas sp. CDS-1]
MADIVVTAQRRAERLQDVPIAVTAIVGETAGLMGVTNSETLNAVTRGDIMGIAMTADQLMGARATPELSQYQIPGIDGLFPTGCTTNPGGLATLGGRASAMKIYQKLGIDLKTGFTNY